MIISWRNEVAFEVNGGVTTVEKFGKEVLKLEKRENLIDFE